MFIKEKDKRGSDYGCVGFFLLPFVNVNISEMQQKKCKKNI